MDQQKIGAALKQLRKSKQLTQQQLAEQFNVSDRTVSRWETGNNMPDIATLIELADFYDVDIRQLIHGENIDSQMKTDLKDTAIALADYADHEKAELLNKARMFSVIGFIALMLGIVLESFFSDIKIPVFEYLKGMCFGLTVGSMLIMILYTNGILAKINEKKADKANTKIITWIAIVIVLVTFVAAVIASIKR